MQRLYVRILILLMLSSTNALADTDIVVTTDTQVASNNSTVTTSKFENIKQTIKKLLFSITTDKPSALQEKLDKLQANNNDLGVSLFNPNYILPAYYTSRPDKAVYQNNTPNNQQIKRLEFQGQLSILVPVYRFDQRTALNLAYTQLSYWQFYAESQYFRETDYMPELFISFNPINNWLFDVGADHQSNGRGGDLERSWNRAYVNLNFARDNWMVGIKPWVLIFKNESSNIHNPDIAHYMGNGELSFAYKPTEKTTVNLMTRNDLESKFQRGTVQATYSYQLAPHFSVYLVGFSGYGQSLIEYNHYTTAAGIGFALNDVL